MSEKPRRFLLWFPFSYLRTLSGLLNTSVLISRGFPLCVLIWIALKLSPGWTQDIPKELNQPQEPQQSRLILSGAVSLHFEIPELGLTYRRVLENAKDLGLTHVALVAQASMSNIHSAIVSLDSPHATSLTTIKQVAELSRSLGLKVIIFPILWINERHEGEWRGTLNPTDLNVWWTSYENWISKLALIAQQCRATHLSIGSELSSLEIHEGRWRALIRRLRASFSGKLMYSANWDHYQHVGFWDALDIIGVTGYYPLALEERTSDIKSMVSRWRWVRAG